MRNRRLLRRIISGILTALLACNIGLMISVAIFYFGVYDQAVLVHSFEKSGYFEEKFEKAQSEVMAVLETVGIPDIIFSFDDLKMSFERQMRSQILNRGDAASELNSISLAKLIMDCIEKQSIETTLKAEEGIVLLSQELSRLLFEQSKVSGIEQWYEDMVDFSEKIPVIVIILGFIAAFDIAAIGVLQSRKYKVSVYVAAGLTGAGIAGIAVSAILFRTIQTGLDGVASQVMVAYRQEVLSVGLKICAAVFVIAVILSFLGLAIKKMQQAF